MTIEVVEINYQTGVTAIGADIAAGVFVELVAGGSITNPGVQLVSAVTDKPYGVTLETISEDVLGQVLRIGKIKMPSVAGIAAFANIAIEVGGGVQLAVVTQFIMGTTLELIGAAGEGYVDLMLPGEIL